MKSQRTAYRDIWDLWSAVLRRGGILLLPVLVALLPAMLFWASVSGWRRKRLGRGGRLGEPGGSALVTAPSPYEAAQNYLQNYNYMQAVCAERGVIYAAALQPVLGLYVDPGTEYDRRIVAVKKSKWKHQWVCEDYYRAFYGSVLSRTTGNLLYLDLTRAFDESTDRQIYYDSVHFSDIGQDIVADRLAAFILSEGMSR